MKEGRWRHLKVLRQKSEAWRKTGFSQIYFLKNIRHLISVRILLKGIQKLFQGVLKQKKRNSIFHNTEKSRVDLTSDTAKFRDQTIVYSTSGATMILSVCGGTINSQRCFSPSCFQDRVQWERNSFFSGTSDRDPFRSSEFRMEAMWTLKRKLRTVSKMR